MRGYPDHADSLEIIKAGEPTPQTKKIAGEFPFGLRCAAVHLRSWKYEGGKEMSRKMAMRSAVAVLFALCMLTGAVAQMPNPYGAPISLENAKKAAALAMAEAAKNGWNMAVAIVDPGGNLVYYEKMDNTQLGSANVAIDKARSAALFKRPTKAFQDVLAAGGEGLRVLRLQGVVPIEGGIPLVMDGKIVGAIGVSGATSAQDAQCAKAGADTIK
jgi:glc operon protein GlcG